MDDLEERIRYGDGVEIDLATGETLSIDASDPAGDIRAVSHAHGDHLFNSDPGSIVSSELTARLAGVRRENVPARTSHPAIELLDAGHVPGSRAVYADDGERTYLYTGDCSIRDRFYLDGFEPRTADVLLIEATYGKPEYVFPPQADSETRIVEWLETTDDRPVVLFGYALGRAQEVQQLAQRAGRSHIYISEAIDALNQPIAEALDVTFDGDVYDRSVDLGPGDALVFPSQVKNLNFVDTLLEETDALTAGFSGWAVDSSFKYANGYDETFVLSDHCDFEELLEVVAAVDPEVVFTLHGATDELAAELTRRGYDARSLKRGQRTLGEF
ncbi:MAG: mRNA 3'-end processing factor [Halorhabdus sp.]